MLDPDHGWMLSKGTVAMGNETIQLRETRDGGLHWEIIYETFDHIPGSYDLGISGFYPFIEHFTFVSETLGFYSDGRLYSSLDGGRSWKPLHLEPPADLPEIDCTGKDCQYIDIVSAPRFTSPQDGTLTRLVYLKSEVASDFLGSFPNPFMPTPFPAAQYLYSTHDGGRTWILRPAPVALGTDFFLDADTGWLFGKSDPDPAAQAQLYQTIDRGQTWTQVPADPLMLLGSEMQFADPQTGFAFFPSKQADFYQYFDARIQAAEKESTLFFTEDGGHSWTEVAPAITP